MNTITKSLVACLLMVGIFNLSTVSARASVPAPTVSTMPKPVSSAPRIVSAGKPLSAQQLTKYQELSSASKTAANNQAAGAGSNTVVWIVVGVVVVVGVAALIGGNIISNDLGN